MEPKNLAAVVVFASVYLALGFIFQNVAFGSIQVRVADALYPLIAVLGLPCLLGTFLGHLTFNIYGFGTGIALGVGDLLSPFIFLLPKFLIWKYGLKAVPTHIIAIALWISYLLYAMFGVPFWLSVITVGIGETIAEIGIGVPLAYAIKKRFNNK